MKFRGLVIACLVFGVLAGTLYWSDHHKSAAETIKADAPPAILKIDRADISRLEFKRKNSEPVLLTKADSGNWQITGPKPFSADQDVVSEIAFTLASLNGQRLVEDKAADLKPYGLDQPAVEIDITEKNNRTHTLLFGDEIPTGRAVYAMLAGDPKIFTVSDYGMREVDKSLNDLRDKRLLTVNPGKISRIELIKKSEDIEFGHNSNDEWQILKPKPLRTDSMQVDNLARKLIDARMDLTGPGADDAGSAFAHAAPVMIAKVTDESGTQELQVRKNKDQYYAKSSVVDGAYAVDAGLGQSLDKSLDDFRAKKLFDFGFSEPDKVELHNGSQAYFLTRSGEDWWSNGKKMDAGTVKPFIGRLRLLTANSLVDSGFAAPTIEATVTSDDGKRVEKVQICRSGDHYVAKRENESDLYQLDSDSVDQLEKAAENMKPAASK